MAKTELKLKSKNAATGQDITTTLTYVNPNADSATLKTFGQKLNALTTNNYVETDRVHTINVDTEQVPINKKEGTFSNVNANVTKTADGRQVETYGVKINGETITSTEVSKLFGCCEVAGHYYTVQFQLVETDTLRMLTPSGNDAGTATIKIAHPANDDYTAVTKNILVNFSG